MNELLEENEKILREMKSGTATKVHHEKLAAIHKRTADLKAGKTAVRTARADEIRTERAKMEAVELRIAKNKAVWNLVGQAEKVDLAFLCDVTGSMGRYIREVKEQICTIVDDLKADFPSLSLRLAFVGYRDHGDSVRFEIFDFSSDVHTFRTFVGSLSASGGKDTAEDVVGGMHKTVNLSWEQTTRAVLHIADAPCHGRQYHDGVNDDYPSGDPDGLRIKPQLDALKQLDVNYIFGRINADTDKMVREFNRELGTEYVQQTPLSDVRMLTEVVTKTVRDSITSAHSRLKRTATSHRVSTFGMVPEHEGSSSGTCSGLRTATTAA